MIGYLAQNHALIAAFGAQTERRTRREALALNRVFKAAPKLSDYLRDAELLGVKGTLDRAISGLAIDSRRVAPGNLFFVLPGLHADGASFIDEAVSRGAAAVITAAKLPALPPARVTFVQVAHARATLAAVAQRYYKFPDRDMSVVGVTGTSGKTTVAHLLRHFLSADQKVGLIGTIHYNLGARTVPALRTTPEALDLFGMLGQMRDAGCRHAVMEVGAHGYDHERAPGLQFGAAIFTNCTSSRLAGGDSAENDFEAKARLFSGANGAAPRLAVVNLDDPWGEKLAARISAERPGVRVITFGEHPRAQVRAEVFALHIRGAVFRVSWPSGACLVDSPLVGRAKVSNVLAAVAAAWGLGRAPAELLGRLGLFDGAPGRMERVDAGQPFNVLVDSAHTDDTLRHALGTLRAITPGKLHVVFGCGGNRDRAKRPLMVRAVQEFADHAYATADNPRTEAIAQIFDDMRAGVSASEKISWIDDRRRALSHALDACQPGDCLLVAGKGHETFQQFADTVFPFDDRQVVRELLATKAQKEA